MDGRAAAIGSLSVAVSAGVGQVTSSEVPCEWVILGCDTGSAGGTLIGDVNGQSYLLAPGQQTPLLPIAHLSSIYAKRAVAGSASTLSIAFGR